MNKTYALMQVMINPRDGSTQMTPYDEFPTLAAAKKASKGMKRWVIIEQKVVAQSVE